MLFLGLQTTHENFHAQEGLLNIHVFMAKEKVVLHLPPGHLPPPFLWHLPPLFLWHLPPPTFVHLPPGQLPPLNFFLIFHLFKRFKMTNFSLEVVMDEVLDM